MIAENIDVTINTDNRLVSSTDTVKELTIAVVRPVIHYLKGFIGRVTLFPISCSTPAVHLYMYMYMFHHVYQHAHTFPISNHLVVPSASPLEPSKNIAEHPLTNY